MSKFKLFWSTLSLPAQAGTIALILLFLVGIFSGGQSCGDSRAKKRYEKEREVLKASIKEKSDAGDESQKKAELEEGEKIKYQIALKAAGEQGRKAMEVVENADKKYVEETTVIDAPIDPVERCRRLCATAKLPADKCPCTAAPSPSQ